MSAGLESFHEDFDVKSPRFSGEFEDIVDDLLRRCPVAHGSMPSNRFDAQDEYASEDFWVVTEFDEIRRCARESELFSSGIGGILVQRPPGLNRQGADERDPPEHTAVRDALNPFFSPGAVKRFETQIREVAAEVIDEFIEDGQCEILSQFSSIFPPRFFFKHLLGVQSHSELKHITVTTENMLSGDHAAGLAFAEWNEKYLKQRSEAPPKGDVVNAILELSLEGEPAPWELRYSAFTNVVLGGLDTTSKQLARTIHFLAVNPDVRRRLVEHPEEIPAAVEESLRLFSPVWYLGRTATANTTIGNRDVKHGDFVLLCWTGANRDPKVFEDPGTWNMDRPVQRHLTFGAGRHRCLGSHLARLELVLALEVFLAKIPDFRMADDTEVVVNTNNVNRKPSAIKIAFDQPA